MAIIPKKEICPVCGRPIRGDVRIKIKDNVELCKVCSSEIEMDSAMIPTQSVEDIKRHLAYRKENRQKMEQFKMTFGAEAGAYILRADQTMRLWYCTNERGDRNPPLFAFEALTSAVYLEDGEPAEDIVTGFKSLFGEKTAPTLVQSMKISIDLDDPYIHQIVIETVAPGTGMTTGTMQYKMNRKNIQDFMGCLEKIRQIALEPPVVEDVEVIPPDEAQIPGAGEAQTTGVDEGQIPGAEQGQIQGARQAQIPDSQQESQIVDVTPEEPYEAAADAAPAESDAATEEAPSDDNARRAGFRGRQRDRKE